MNKLDFRMNRSGFFMEDGWDLLLADDKDKDFECSNCGRIINGSEQVEWVDRQNNIFKCPACENRYELIEKPFPQIISPEFPIVI